MNERALYSIGDMLTPGMEIQFARGDAGTAREDLRQMIEKLRARLPGKPLGALYHSCLGRGRNLFGGDSEAAVSGDCAQNRSSLTFSCGGW